MSTSDIHQGKFPMYKESLFGGFVAFDASVGIGFALAVAGVFFLSFDVNTVFSLSTEPVSTASKRSSSSLKSKSLKSLLAEALSAACAAAIPWVQRDLVEFLVLVSI